MRAGRSQVRPEAILIVGGGAAGLLAAIASGRAGVPATLLERNSRLGTKILLSGGGRCNLTNAGDTPHLVSSFPGNGKFLYSAFTRFGGDEIRTLLAEAGVETRVEDRGRVFPTDGGAKAVVAALERAARKAGATIHTGTPVDSVRLDDSVRPGGGARQGGAAFTVLGADGRSWRAARVILASGGVTYPSTGTTGDGYRWAREMGHTVVPPRPALVALETRETWPGLVPGVALRGATVYVHAGGRIWDQSREDVLFTHFGLSGPAVLNVSRQAVVAGEACPGEVVIGIRLDPETPPDAWRNRLEDRIRENPRRMVRNLFEGWWPASLARVLCGEAGAVEPGAGEAGADPRGRAGQLPRAVRDRLAAYLFELRLTLARPRPIEEAMVTAGGVSVREVDPRSMASRLVPGLFIAGEMLDVDGLSGGYNLQAAFSTGWLAGETAARDCDLASGMAVTFAPEC